MQQNTLFDRLTVSEHISLFQRLKGVRASTSSIRQRAEEIGLEEYVHTTSDALSGGNKRKLSVAVALCGDPAFLVSNTEIRSILTCVTSISDLLSLLFRFLMSLPQVGIINAIGEVSQPCISVYSPFFLNF